MQENLTKQLLFISQHPLTILRFNYLQTTFHYDLGLWFNNETFDIEGDWVQMRREQGTDLFPNALHYVHFCIKRACTENKNHIVIHETASSLF